MKTFLVFALLLLGHAAYTAEGIGVLVYTAIDPANSVQFKAPAGTCSAGNPAVGALAPVRGKPVNKPERPINYYQTAVGGYICAHIGTGTFKITAPPGVAWVVTNSSMNNITIGGKDFGIGETVSGTGSRTFIIE